MLMAIAHIDKQQVAVALKSTGSSDLDILFARKEELLAESKRWKPFVMLPILLGGALCLTILGAVAGIPAIVFGIQLRKRIRANIETAESAYTDYVSALATRSQTVIA